jgi:hypothetical protein
LTEQCIGSTPAAGSAALAQAGQKVVAGLTSTSVRETSTS